MTWRTDGSSFARQIVQSLRGSRAPDASFWSHIVIVDRAPHSHFEQLTRDAARSSPLPGPVAMIAGTCDGLRGFHGRQWISAAGNLHLAVAIPLDGWSASAARLLPILPALATREAIAASGADDVPATIKWINDVYRGSGKAAGILTRTSLQGDRSNLLITGIGINVGVAPALPPSPFVPRSAAIPADLAVLLGNLLAALARRCGEPSPWRLQASIDEYRSASSVLGRRVRVYPTGVDERLRIADWPSPVACGTVMEIRDDLSLQLDSCREPVRDGRLAFEEDCREFGL